jgi:hypothetical protein
MQSVLKMLVLLQAALTAETHLAEGLAVKLRCTVKVEKSDHDDDDDDDDDSNNNNKPFIALE